MGHQNFDQARRDVHRLIYHPDAYQRVEYNPDGHFPLQLAHGRFDKPSYVRLDSVRKIHASRLTWCRVMGTSEFMDIRMSQESIEFLLNTPVPACPFTRSRPGTASPPLVPRAVSPRTSMSALQAHTWRSENGALPALASPPLTGRYVPGAYGGARHQPSTNPKEVVHPVVGFAVLAARHAFGPRPQAPPFVPAASRASGALRPNAPAFQPRKDSHDGK